MSEEIGEILLTEEELQDKIRELAKRITEDYRDRDVLLVGVLKGAFILMSDLAREIALPVEFDFMAVSSYGSATRTSGVVRILKDFDFEISGRHVLLVEDIIDSGLTLLYLLKYLWTRKPASLEVCALMRKAGIQKVAIDVRYEGFEIPPVFVVGYGLDYMQKYRNLPYVAVLKDGPSG
ncbi:MAG TPA: hypoxanthine phosphoribosyltransferase [Actinomycetota bacterium]|nr:hypoxanthine phosphoribosyltransferase [Actinomycetota bacterium]